MAEVGTYVALAGAAVWLLLAFIFGYIRGQIEAERERPPEDYDA